MEKRRLGQFKRCLVQYYWKKRAIRDPDLWVLELDVASGARLDGLMTALN